MVRPDSIDGEEHFAKAKDAALRFLTYRARSEAEVRRRLSKKFSPEQVEQVIQSLLRQNFLDDGAFAQAWRDNREQHRPRAKRMVQQELRQLGVASAIIQDSLDGFSDETNAYQAGVKLAGRLASRKLPDEDFRRRISSLLQRRGFSYGTVRETVARLCGELGADSLHRQHDAENNEENPQAPESEPRGDAQQAEQS
jgi:regulatory protein